MLRPFFPYYGSKWRAFDLYPAPGPVIVEPFAGSAGYATRYPDRRVLLIDSDPVIAGLWAYLIRATPAELLRIPDVPAGATVFDVAWPCEEARWLAGFWLTPGVFHPALKASSWAINNPGAGRFWGAAVRERLAAQVPAIRHWEIRNCSYADAPDVEATWFVDPPYQVHGRKYRHSSKRIDYANLGAWCAARRGCVTVCEQEGATWLPFQPLGDIRASTRGGVGRVSREVVWRGGASHCP